jgi:hypothetical protein
MTTNQQFLEAIFGGEYGQVHVTCFYDDPNNIPKHRSRICWIGDRYKNSVILDGTNQYFTISLFKDDEEGKPRRRKVDFIATHCIVLDDVKEKLSLEQAKKLPKPTWILETSKGSEQWGYILERPCKDRGRVENLLDGLVANGLAPNGKDPGMKGVTRYVRLPEGINNKSNKLIDGEPYDCTMVEWHPERKCTLSDLAKPFYVNLDKQRRESKIEGASIVADHPLLQHPEALTIKTQLSPGRYEVQCPWMEEHTGGVDNGAAIFTNGDGSLGFKCHHGHCEERTGKDLMGHMEDSLPGFGGEYKRWVLIRSLKEIKKPTGIEEIIDKVSRSLPGTEEQGNLVRVALSMVEEFDTATKISYQKRIADQLGWNERDLNKVIQSIKAEERKNQDIDFYSDAIYVAEQNQFFDRRKRLWLTTEAYRNKYSHVDPDALKVALAGGRAIKVDKLDYCPKMPAMFERDDGVVIGNTWCRQAEVMGVEGDCSPWFDHFDRLGWGMFREHILQWMAYTIRHPEEKINHGIILGGHEGSGKDWILEPLLVAMKGNGCTISGEELLDSDFSGYLFEAKHLHINEVEPGSRADAAKIYKRLKPMTAAPPKTLRAHDKRVKAVEITNIVNVTMTTNSKLALQMSNGHSRRLFALWTDVDVRHSNGAMTNEWREYWRENWHWMENGGAEACIWYLRNKVDLSSFYAKEAPPVSPFLQEMVSSSKVVSII